ncbi:MAG: site-specific DNA-methyltransferase, partial [Bacteroidota bacterium]
PRMDAIYFSSRHDSILCFAKDKEKFKVDRSILEEEIPDHYDKVDDNGREYYLKPLRTMGGADSREERPNLYFGIQAPNGNIVFPKRKDGSDGAWRWSKKKIKEEEDRIEWIEGRNGWSPYYKIYAENRKIRPPETIWTHKEVGSNRTSKAEIKKLFPNSSPFGTPKPEKLIHRIIALSSKEDDFILDSFLGSGTTSAVAHKMGRKHIGIELGDHAKTLCNQRLRKVIDGEQGGISPLINWQGGGGFKFYTLAPSLLKKDKYGNWIIDEQYNADMLAAAMAKQEGFRYDPDVAVYWKQGPSTEKDFIYTTTQFMTLESLDRIKDEMQKDQSLLICCKAFQKECKGRHGNISIKKIPHMLLGRCEFGKNDYSLNIIDMPEELEVEPNPFEGEDLRSIQEINREENNTGQQSLF